jgi:hypothetical protein
VRKVARQEFNCVGYGRGGGERGEENQWGGDDGDKREGGFEGSGDEIRREVQFGVGRYFGRVKCEVLFAWNTWAV